MNIVAPFGSEMAAIERLRVAIQAGDTHRDLQHLLHQVLAEFGIQVVGFGGPVRVVDA